MKPLLIGLSGRKRSGKDTFAARLVADHGFVRVALADPMKDMALAIDPFVAHNFTADAEEDRLGHVRPIRLSELVERLGWEEAKGLPEVRRTLQRLGTEGGREILGDTIWIDAAFVRINKLLNAGTSVVVTDVRFTNEAEAIVAELGHVLRIERAALAPSGDLHPSETELDDWTGFSRIIPNVHGIEFLNGLADRAVADLLSTHARAERILALARTR